MRDVLKSREMSLGVGPEVVVRLESTQGAARQGEALAVFRALDAMTHQRFEILANGSDGRSGDLELANAVVAASCLLRVENLDLSRLTGSQSAAGKRLRKWLAGRAPEAAAFIEATVPVYMSASLPDQLETDSLELAAYILLERQNGKNPYEVGSHRAGCDRDIWEDREADQLRPLAELDGENCQACMSDRRLYRDVIKEVGSSLWLDAARRAFSLSRQIEQFPRLAETISARNWLYVEIVRAEIEKRRIYNDWEAGEEMKSKR